MTDAIPTWRESGEGRRGLVLLHGIGGGSGLWGPTLPALEDYRVLAWDMPGYGASPPVEPGFPALAAALGRMLDAAELDRADLVGHSIGGMVALEFALTYPDRVRSLVLYASPPAFGGRGPDFRDRFLAARLAPLDAGRGMAALAPEVVEGLLGDDPDPEAAPAAIASMAAVPESGYRAALATLVTFDRRADLGRVEVPTLVLVGEADALAPFPVMHGMAGAIPGARMAIIAYAGHLAHLERPTEFNAMLCSFLDRVAED
ncbi:alpha/beta fold hydrolase [Belnapia sp. T6]|uniref:Alpha/beta fold hydrolase n=1 Tax=Belnapia mucosa TaxID=2804532 RepID=A0ABS1V150_9PROT|nr:alpha/beta fold hydrolase [Belnapia mucosa]MBL6455433.1 alpha/beta fold hydrolase [Belnapia mucosa]